MSYISRYSQLIIFLFAVIASIIIGFNHQSHRAQQVNSVPTPKIVKLNPQPQVEKKIEKKVESPIKSSQNPTATSRYKTTLAVEQYQPKYVEVAIHPSNYGDRYSVDVNGNSLNNLPIVVLHETTNSARSAINTFRTHHQNDNDQVSYHTLITLDGTIIYLVPSDKRAFGAGNSVFKSSQGIETVKTNPNLASSVNNFAYHVSLETPLDGRKMSQSYHSGYTEAQYKSLAWLVALSDIPEERVTTHQNVDLSGQRFDPRSFDFDKFLAILHTFRQPIAESKSVN